MKRFGIIALLTFLLINICSLDAQQRGRGTASMGVISGKIIDSETGKPLPYTNVIVKSMKDSSIVTGAISDEDGSFKIKNVRPGRFFVELKFIGYKTKIYKNVVIKPDSRSVDMETVRLNPAEYESDGIEVTAERDRIEYKVDKKIVNVAGDISASGGSAVEALENVPSVTVDIEGDVSLRGSTNFTVFINGRPSVLEGSDALKQIPAETIDYIELITNPSAKYDPDGMAGIINVVLKKDAEGGLNGITNISVGTRDKYSADVLLNYRNSDWSFFAGLDYSDQKFHGQGESEKTTTIDDSTSFFDATSTGRFNRLSYGAKLGAGYNLTEYTSVNLEGKIGQYGRGRFHTSKTAIDAVDSDVNTEYHIDKTDSDRERFYYSGTLDIIHKFDDLGQKIALMAYYSDRDGDEESPQKQYITNENWQIEDDNPYIVNTHEDDISKNYRFKADYTYPYSTDTKFEAGYQARIDDDIEKYYLEEFDPAVSQWVTDETFSNDMDYYRAIHSIYSTFTSKISDLSFQLGLRGEYTDRQIGFTKAEKDFIIDRLDIFPTAHASYDIGGGNQIMGSYSRRIRRPRGWDLEPFPNYFDQYNVRIGNPELEPEYANSYELSWQKTFDMSFVTLEAYYRNTVNRIDRISRLREDGIMEHTVMNLNEDHAIGGEIMLNYRPVMWLNFNLGGSVFHYEIEGDIVEEGTETSTESWHGRFNVIAMLSQDTRLQINSFFRGPTITSQGEREGFFTLSAALRQDLFDNKVTLTLNARDLLGSMKREFSSSGQGFTSYNLFERESQIIQLTFTYRYNDYQDKSKRGMNGEGSEEVIDFGY